MDINRLLSECLEELRQWKRWCEELEYCDMADAGRIEYPSDDLIERLEKTVS